MKKADRATCHLVKLFSRTWFWISVAIALLDHSIWLVFDIALNVSKFHRFSKNMNQKLWGFLPCSVAQYPIFGSYFGRKDDFINSFWNLLTFNLPKVKYAWPSTAEFDRICAEIIFREVISSNFTLEVFPKENLFGNDFSKCKKVGIWKKSRHEIGLTWYYS